MAVKFKTKQQKNEEPQYSTSLSEVSTALGVVDKLGELNRLIQLQMAAVKPLQEKYKELEKELLDKLLSDQPELGGELFGEKYRVKYSKKAEKTEITSMDRVVEILEVIEPGLFVELAKVGITDLRDYMTPAQLEECTKTELSGKRRLIFKEL